MGKPKKGKKDHRDNDDDDVISAENDKLNLLDKAVDDGDILIHQKKSGKNKKKGKQVTYSDDEDNENDMNDGTKRKQEGKTKSVFSMLGDEGDMVDSDDYEDKESQPKLDAATKPLKNSEQELVGDDAYGHVDSNKKKKKDKKKKNKNEEDDLDAILADIETPTEQKSKKSKKAKQNLDNVENKVTHEVDIDENIDLISENLEVLDSGLVEGVSVDKKLSKIKKHENDMTAEELTEMIESKGSERVMTIEDLENQYEDKKKKKKSKKEKKDEEIAAEELAEMIEAKGSGRVVTIEDLENEYEDKKKKKKSKKEKKDEEIAAEELAEMIEAKGSERVVTIEDLENEYEDKKKKKLKKEKIVEKDSQEKGEEDEGLMIKTAAQKRKEKKERDKEKEREKKKKGKKQDSATQEGDIVSTDTSEPSASMAQPDAASITDTAADMEKEVPSKKKKKGKKDEKEKEKEKKPKNKQIAAIREHLRMLQEEEQRAIREAEERERKAEEALRLKEEQKRLAEEKKQLKRQKEKEKIERQKREGTYLTAKQKAEKRRAEQMLEMMKAQGMAIPDRDAAPRKKPVYSSRRRNKPQTPSEESKTLIDEIQVDPATIQAAEVSEKSVDEADAVEEVDDVKDAWDESEGEQDDEDGQDEEETSESGDMTTSDAKVTLTSNAEDKAALEKQTSKSEESESESEEEMSSDEESDSDEESSSSSEDDQAPLERARDKIQKRHEEAEKKRSPDNLRAPVVCVLGHVDTGKTKILDKLRRTNVQDGEAGGITQQIGATNVPKEAILDKTLMCKEFQKEEFKLPGMLIIDTPGHESFTNLRTRGSSLCDIAVLVVDIMHGLEPQTIESINLLRKGHTPFVVALNKVDRLYQWKPNPQSHITNTISKQLQHTKLEFNSRVQEAIVQFAEQGLNVMLFNENKNPREYISMVPTSAHTGDGMGNLLALLCQLSQNMLAKRLAYSDELQATVMEVKTLPGLGTTIDVILVNGVLREGNTIVIPGTDGPIISQIRGLLLPQPMKELRVKNQYEHCKEVPAAQGIKVIGKDFEKAMAGLPLYVAYDEDEVYFYKEELKRALEDVLGAIKLSDRGVFVQASTIGSLEALLEFLKTSKIPYAGINIGPVHKKDIMKASVMLEHDTQYAVILAFDVKIERDAQEMADSLGVRVFSADIIYHLFDKFMSFRDELKKGKQEEFRHVAVYPSKLRILPQFVFNSRDPIVAGVQIEAGMLKVGTPICIPSKEFLDLGRVSSIEYNHKPVESARKGQEVCIKIESSSNDAPKMFGRHFDHTDLLVSKISRQSIDVMKEWFRDDLQKSDWQLIVELKKTFEII